MKKVMIGLLLIISTSVINAQETTTEKETKTITYEEMKSISKGAFQTILCDIYVAKDGHQYKIGDTLKIGRPSSNKTFAFIYESSGAMDALAGKAPEPLSVSASGSNTIVKKIGVGGTKRTGFKIYVISKGVCSLCPQYYSDFEEALATGEIQSFGLTREQAIAKLKEAKDLVDLGLMTKEDFEKLKDELSKIIMQKQ
jgi:hypothetical protein